MFLKFGLHSYCRRCNVAIMRKNSKSGGSPTPTGAPLIARLRALRQGHTVSSIQELLTAHGVPVSRATVRAWLEMRRSPRDRTRTLLEAALCRIEAGQPPPPMQKVTVENIRTALQQRLANTDTHWLAQELKRVGLIVPEETLRQWAKGRRQPDRRILQSLFKLLKNIRIVKAGEPLASLQIRSLER